MKVISILDARTGEILSQREIRSNENAERLYEILKMYLTDRFEVFIFDPKAEEDW